MSLSKVPCAGLLLAIAFTTLVSRSSHAQTTLAAGDIAITGYHSTDPANDRFSFVLLAPITAGTVINFTDNGWLSTNVFRAGEQTVTWTAGSAFPAGTEVTISGPAAGTPVISVFNNASPAGTVTGSMLSLSVNGDQVLVYQGTAGSPTFITALHMNVYDTGNGDPVTTTAAAWDGTANTANASALPTGLATGTNCIWIGTQGNISSERNNGVFNCSGTLTTVAGIRAAVNNQANWTTEFVISGTIPSMPLPSGCSFLGGSAPSFSLNPVNSTICAGANTSFTITASGATSLQWQVDAGSGFTNLTNTAPYSGVTTATLTITAATTALNGYLYRCVATNGTGSTNSSSATLTVNPLPVNPTLLAKTPASASVADGTPVSATFNAGSGGTGCTDDFRYTTNGGATYLSYTPGSNISTTGLAAGSGIVFIEGRRAGCSSSCQGGYEVLASWIVSPLPAGATTLNAGDIAFSGYKGHGASATSDEFSFVLLRNVGPGTVINFTNNGWLSTNVFRTGEETVTWTAPAGGLPAGTEISIAGLTATRSGGGAAGAVTGTALLLSANGDQVLAYRGSAAAPTFISAIHMNVYSTSNGDPVSTTTAAWDGTQNNSNASSLPTGLSTGLNCIWIGVQDDINSEFDNARYGTCSLPATLGSISALRAALNNPANWTKTNNDPPGFNLPTGCNYLSSLTPSVTITGTPLTAFSACQGTASAEQSFSVSGNALSGNIIITAPAGYEVSTTSGSGFASSVTLTPVSGAVSPTTIYVRIPAAATGNPAGNITVASTGVTTQNVAVTGTTTTPPTVADAGLDQTVCGSLTTTLTGNTPVTGTGTWTPISGPGTASFTNANAGNSGVSVSATGVYVFRWTIANAPCPDSFDEVTVTFGEPPSTANAGPDISACISPGTVAMAANVPTTGSGSWTQVSGPSTAIIFTSGSATSNIGGLTTAGTYRFRWTISNAPCPSSFDEVDIVVNTNPSPFTLAGGGVYCPSDVTLTGPADPNYTYTWQRSLSGIANPNSFTTFGGTAQTQVVNISGNYRLVVTNQFGCSASDTAAVSMADYVFNGSLAIGDLQQTGRLNRFAVVSTCAAPKACPGTFTTSGARLYDAYTITNPRSVPVCATIGIASGCGVNMFSVAYSGSFDPNNLCANYLADPGSSFPNVGYYEATIPANGTIVVVVHEVNTATGCPNYTLTVDVPRDPAAISVVPNTPPICTGTSLTITGAVANSYTWTPGGATTQAITVSPATTSQYNVTYGYGNNGCTRLDSVTVNIAPVVTTAFAGNDTATCGTTITLAANTAVVGTGSWSVVNGPGTVSFGNANDPASTATASVNGVYTLRWTITAGAPCPGSTQDDVLVNFAGNPSTADAGTDKTACINPGSVAMTATTPTTGTGTWTQVAGPSTAVIVNPTSPTTNIINLNTLGTYTFRWTVSNSPCPSNFDDVNVVVNGNPVPFTVAGGGVYCPSDVTLTGPADPNYTYTWQRSLSGIANPNSFTTFGGTAQTQVVNTSGNYRLVVTNQFGCTASDTASVSVADYVFNGSLASGDLQQTGRLNRFGVVSTCAAPKACPGTFTTSGARLYDAYTITNPRSVPVCATIGIASGCGVNMFSVAYSGSFDPNNLCANYLADPGSSFPNVGYYEATIPANGTIVVVVHEVNTGAGCANYTLTVDVPREPALITAVPPSVPCASSSTLTASVAGSYLWVPGGQTTPSITTPPLFTPTNYMVYLGHGNVGCQDSAMVTVNVSSVPPSVTCPSNITVGNATNQCGNTVTYTTSAAGTPTPTLSYSFSGATTGSGAGDGSGSFFNVGVTTVTVTATNICGSNSCSFTVTVNDTEAPTVTAGTIASCYPTVAVAEAAALAATSATDNCPGALTEVASTVGTCSAVITVRTSDAAGNFADVSYNTRIDNTAPTVTAGTIASCYPTVAAAEAAALAATSATDNCPGALTEVASTVGTCSAVITVTTTDACGNITLITYNTRIDNTAPTVTAGTIASCYPTVAAAEAAALAATSATDNCPGALTEVAGTVGTCSAVITVTTSDACGNSTSVTYNTRIDNTPPTFTCPSNLTVGCASAVPPPNIGLISDASDNCGGPVAISHQGDVISGQTCANRYTIARTYRVTDACGNFSECVQTITVNDQTPPTLTCPAPVTVSCASQVPAPNIASVTGVSDNCGGVVTVTHVGDVISAQTCANRYTITRTYRATDVCGNFAECTQIITVNDQTEPVITACPGPVTVSCASAVPAVNTALVTATDNCGGVVTITHVSDVISAQTCANRYTVTRTYRATDVCGNFADCVQIITVNDQTPPVITACPAPVTVSCASAVPAVNTALVTATDNCAGTVTITHVSDVISNQTCANRYTLTRTYRATDVCGNFTNCVQVITVNDQTAPVITCPANITVTTPVGSCTAVVNFTVTATDNCGTVTVTSVPASGSAFPIGTTTVTSTATDACGNTATCTFTVTVNDAQLPVITAQPANRTVCAGTAASFSVTAITSPSANGPLSYQWQLWNGTTWTDISGATAATYTINSTTVSQNNTSYRVRVIGLCTTVISNHATLVVNPNPTVSITPSIPPALLPGQNLSLTAQPNPAGGGSYQWQLNGANIAGATSQTLEGITVDRTGLYRVIYTDANGCVGTSAALEVTAKQSGNLWVYPNPNQGVFNIRFYNRPGEEITVRVLDNTGREVHRQKTVTTGPYTNIQVNLNRQPVASESYIVEIRDSQGVQVGAKRILVYR